MRWPIILLLLLMPATAEGKKMAIEDTAIYPLMVFPSYIKTIKNSVGSKMFRNLYYDVEEKTQDVLSNGNLSCAYFVSTILRHFGLVSEWRTSVDGLVEEMKKNGWTEIKKPVTGSVIVWEARASRPGRISHKHIGFSVGGGRAVSNVSKNRSPTLHSVKFDGRKIVAIFWNAQLNAGGKNDK